MALVVLGTRKVVLGIQNMMNQSRFLHRPAFAMQLCWSSLCLQKDAELPSLS